MTWARQGNIITSPRSKLFSPVIALIAAEDEFISVESQVRAMEQFAANHPQVPVVLVYTDLAHDPMRGLDYRYLDPKTQKPTRISASARSGGKRFKDIFKKVVLERRHPYLPAAIERIMLPEYEFALRKLVEPSEN